jgi:hypothetical protein
MTGRGRVDAVPTSAPGAGGDRVLGLFLAPSWRPGGLSACTRWGARSRRSGSDGSTARWASSSSRALCFPLRVERDRFVWAGPEMCTVHPALEAFRFDLESRGIREGSYGSIEILRDVESTIRAAGH